MPWDRVPHVRLLTRLMAAALVLFLAAVGIVKSNSIREVRPAEDGTASSAGSFRIEAPEQAKTQASSPVPRAQAVGQAARSVALVIGNARYPDDEAPLRQPLFRPITKSDYPVTSEQYIRECANNETESEQSNTSASNRQNDPAHRSILQLPNPFDLRPPSWIEPHR
jgi:formylglycine-generating enzyme required for sulfatase activity